MIRILLVDDKVDVVSGIKKGVSWELIGDIELFEAYSGQEALQIVKDQKIDLLITDIEMPGMNGIELAGQVREISPGTGIVFLSSHDSFRYAQNAVRLGIYDYILQPVDYNTLRQSIERVLQKLREETGKTAGAHSSANEEKDEAYNAGRIDKNRAWRRVVVSDPPYTPEMARETLQNVGITPDESAVYRLVLLKLYWQKGTLGGWKVNELEDAFVRKMEETIRKDLPLVRFIPMYDNEWILLFKEADISTHMQLLVGTGENESAYRLAAYVAEPCGFSKLHAAYLQTLELRNNNVSNYSGVYEYSKNQENERPSATKALSVHRWKGWLLEENEQLIADEISSFLREKEKKRELKKTSLALIVQMVTDVYYNSEEEKLRDLMNTERFSSLYLHASESIDALLSYVRALETAYTGFRSERNEEIGQALVRKIKNYITAHLQNRLSRAEISEEFYISRDYVSHLFSKYENINYTQYVTECRMERAKELLRKTSLPINVIAGAVGVSEYSYFSKVFRDYTGMSANEYRQVGRKND